MKTWDIMFLILSRINIICLYSSISKKEIPQTSNTSFV